MRDARAHRLGDHEHRQALHPGQNSAPEIHAVYALGLMKPLRSQAGVEAVPDLESFDVMLRSLERGEDDRLLRQYWKRLTR